MSLDQGVKPFPEAPKVSLLVPLATGGGERTQALREEGWNVSHVRCM